MFASRPQDLALAMALISPLTAFAAPPANSPQDSQGQPVAATVVALASAQAASAPTDTPQQVEVTGARVRLDAARNALSPDTGSSVFRFDTADLGKLPQGETTPLNQVVLQAPGVVQDAYGQLHVRGDHGNVQYRINGVVVPEAIGGFGQALQTRLASRVDVLTGALPAQYGYRTAAVVDIQTKGQEPGQSGSLSLSGNRIGRKALDGDIGGSQGALSYYFTGSLARDPMGIDNPTPERSALHDVSDQAKGFGYLSYVLSEDTRLNLMLGTANNRFEIPDVPGLTPAYTLSPATAIDSATLNARQAERSRFGVLSLQSHQGDLDYQVSLFQSASQVHYTPDPVGDLVFNGVASDVQRQITTQGVQADASLPWGSRHTLRAGLFAQHDNYSVNNQSLVFPADANGNQTSSTPLSITDNSGESGHLWGAYLQDEWQPVKALTINYGVRYDQVHTVVHEHQLSPRLGAVYDLSDSLRLHVGYARYFTPPPTEKIDTTSVQKFLGTTNALPSDANTAVMSERSNYFDAGLSWQATPKITFGLDAYYRQVAHLQDEGQFGNALIFSAFNYQRGRVTGLEASAGYHDKAWSAYANVAVSRAMAQGIETGQFNFAADELAYIADHWVHLDHDQHLTASAGLSHQGADGTTLSGDLLFGSGLRNGFANSSHLPAYSQVNVAASRTFSGAALGPVELRLSVLNLFDRIYQLRDGTGIALGAPQYGPRRTLTLGLTKRF